MSSAFKRILRYVFAGVGMGYLLAVGHATYFSKATDERAAAMLKQVRYQLDHFGVSDVQKNVGLEFGYYGGCRVWLLEHLIVNGCFGLRMDDDVLTQAPPERIKQIIEDICHTDIGACPYSLPIALSVRYMRTTRTYEVAKSITEIREQSARSFHYWIRGGNS